MNNKQLPYDLEAERAILGIIYCATNNSVISQVANRLHWSKFYAPNHQVIIKVMTDLYNENYPVDALTINHALNSQKLMDDIGGIGYLLDLSDSAPVFSNVEKYIEIVETTYKRRELIAKAYHIMQTAYDESIAFENIIDEAEKEILKINQNSFNDSILHISDIADEEFEEASKAKEEGYMPSYVSSGISSLDEALNGGFNPSDLIILAARPAMGKTAFALNIAHNIALINNLPVVIFSLEMSKNQVVQRIISTKSDISLSIVKKREIPNQLWGIYTEAIVRTKGNKIYIDDSGDTKPSDIKAKCRRLKAEHKKIGAVIIDYLQLIDLDSKIGKDNRVQEISKITRELKKLARELDCPIICLSQLSRNVESRQNKRPMLADLRDSGSIEQDADIVMFLYRDEYYNPDSDKKKQAELIIAKYRNGATDTVNLFFDSRTTQFSGLEVNL